MEIVGRAPSADIADRYLHSHRITQRAGPVGSIGLGFAIPIDQAKRIAEGIVESSTVNRRANVITAADGEPVSVAAELVAAVARRDIGDELALTLRRDGTIHNVAVRLGRFGQLPGPALGIAVGTVNFDIELPLPG